MGSKGRIQVDFQGFMHRKGEGIVPLRSKRWNRGVLVTAALCMVLSGCGRQAFEAGTEGKNDPIGTETENRIDLQEISLPESDYCWNFEEGDGDRTISHARGGKAEAVLCGTARIAEEEIVKGNVTYSREGNHVLVLGGGAKGSSYVDLPADLYQGVSAETGLTYSFWAKPDAAVGSYTRILSSAKENGTEEFAFTPHAQDCVWNVLFDDVNVYRSVYSEEPQKGEWSLITFTISKEEITLYLNGEEVGSTIAAGGEAELTERLNDMEALVQNSLGKTNSNWTDADCKVTLDDVCLYKQVLSAAQIATMANEYGFKVDLKETVDLGSDTELTDGTKVTEVEGLSISSPDGSIVTRIMTDEKTGRFFYTTAKNDQTILQASMLGIRAKTEFTEGLSYVEGSRTEGSGVESYDLTTGAASHVEDPYQELAFDLEKEGTDEKLTVTLRVFDGGVAYRYTLHGESGKTEKILGEAGEYVLPATATVWAGNTMDVNYEFDYNKRSMKHIKVMEGRLPIPLLANEGEIWALIAESGVYHEEEPYCASVLYTEKGSRSLKMAFGNGQATSVEKTYGEDGTFHTPWRTVAVTDCLEDLVQTTIFTSLNPQPDQELYSDTSYIRQGKATWSWWSEAGDDPVRFEEQKDFIDFAAENGWEYCCVDFGWCLWDNYKEKVKELVEYGAKRNVGIILWYGVNNDNHSGFRDAEGNPAYPTYSLKTTEQLEEQFAWCHEVGVQGVKVDYYENDNQKTMRQMYECATIAAKNRLNVLFHGCNVPSGEQRTFPNVLGYEAVRGAEWFKWNIGPTISSQLTYLFTRNILGGMDYTPPVLKINANAGTSGYQLAQIIVYESGLQNYASSVYMMKDYAGLPLMNEIAVQWDETKLLEGYPGEFLSVARRAGDHWYVGMMTAKSRELTLDLSFLEDGDYELTLYQDNAFGTEIVTERQTVSKDTTMKLQLLDNGGASISLKKIKE